MSLAAELSAQLRELVLDDKYRDAGGVFYRAAQELERLQALFEQPEKPEDHGRLLGDKSARYYVPQSVVESHHPTVNGSDHTYQAAMVMVGERHRKADLVALVNCLLQMPEHKKPTIAEMLDKLDTLYSKTYEDWVLEVHYLLTEPVCPTVVIHPENNNALRYRVDCDSIEEGIATAVELVHREIILGEKIEPKAPFTNPDDAAFEEQIKRWQKGEKR